MTNKLYAAIITIILAAALIIAGVLAHPGSRAGGKVHEGPIVPRGLVVP